MILVVEFDVRFSGGLIFLKIGFFDRSERQTLIQAASENQEVVVILLIKSDTCDKRPVASHTS